MIHVELSIYSVGGFLFLEVFYLAAVTCGGGLSFG